MAPGFGLVMMLACAAFYYRLGESEYSSGWVLGGASLGLWLAGMLLLGFGWVGCLLLQAALFAALALWRLVRSPIGK